MPRAAWEACGKPNGPSAIINIRARGRTLKRSREAELAGATTEAPAETSAEAPCAPKKRRKVYINAKQTEQLNRRKAEDDAARKEIYKQATREVAAARSAGTLGKPGSRYADFASSAQALLPEDATAQPTVPPKTPLAPLQPTRAPTAAAAGSVDDATLGAMSPAEQAALMVRLSALMSGPPSPSDAVPPRT